MTQFRFRSQIALSLCLLGGIHAHAADLDSAEEGVADSMNRYYEALTTGPARAPAEQDALAKVMVEPQANEVNNALTEKRETFLNSVLDKVYDNEGNISVPGPTTATRKIASDGDDKEDSKKPEAKKDAAGSLKSDNSGGGYIRKAAVEEEKKEKPKEVEALDGSAIPREIEFVPQPKAKADKKTPRKPAQN